ncbi:MAG: hypothetical protein ABIQ10_05195 [Gemmatimonadaceae bacterium]
MRLHIEVRAFVMTLSAEPRRRGDCGVHSSVEGDGPEGNGQEDCYDTNEQGLDEDEQLTSPDAPRQDSPTDASDNRHGVRNICTAILRADL